MTTPAPIGGSEAAAACGIDPWLSRVELWAIKTGRWAREVGEPARWGQLLEPVIVAALVEDGWNVKPPAAREYRDDTRPWMIGHTDGIVEAEPRGLLEVKTASRWTWDTDVPLHYQAQVQHYLYLTGYGYAKVACLIGGQRLEVHHVERDDEAIGTLLELEAEFWQHVVNDTPPPPDGSDSAGGTLLALFPQATVEKSYRLTADEWARWKHLKALREQRDIIDRQVAELEQGFKLAMGDAETIISPLDTTVAHWRNTSSSRIDVKRLQADAPHVAAQYRTTTTTRRFTLA